ncbi:hypothetical protein LVD13_11305 [Flavobacteriaceae bacterium D16]|jgi:hypothetical protein|nr:hypothetical protein [Flavobacteriaceae bacterium D16]
MFPSKKDNIYPLNKENINAILNHFFDIPFGNIKWLYKQSELSINQLEFVARKVAEHQELLEERVGPSGVTVSNFMTYGIEASYRNPYLWKGSQSRKKIIKELSDKIYELF